MIVVSDTTPIISLMKAGQLELLQKLFGTVYIPKAVYQELTENETFPEEVRMVQECEFLYVEEVGNEKSVAILQNFTGLDAGESEAISFGLTCFGIGYSIGKDSNRTQK